MPGESRLKERSPMEMPLAIVGGQWGDEGKGKIVHLLSGGADLVARYQGGHNAGHTVIISGSRFALHLVPSGILAEHKICVIGNGIVIDPEALVKEIRSLKESGVDVRSLRISDRAHLLLPQHALLDQLRESSAGSTKIGTTGRGIGPCYESKYSREGVRTVYLLDRARLKEEVFRLSHEKNRYLELMYGNAGVPPEKVYERFCELADDIAPLVTDTGILIESYMKSGKKILLEGAQGTMLDVDHGTYPFVTSSNSTAGGACTGLGIPPSKIRGTIGVFKAYCTRVGGGPFVTELPDATGDLIRERGKEYGTTTGRPRRCGWFDAVVARYAARVNGLDAGALTLLDVLDAFDTVKVCTAYEFEGARHADFPSAPWVLQGAKPIYEEIPGWKEDIFGTREWERLPQGARDYIAFLEKLVGIPFSIVSTGPDRTHTIVRDESLRKLAQA